MWIIISHNARTPDNLLHRLTADAIALCRGAIALTESCGTFSLSEDAGSITGGNSEVSVVYRLGTHGCELLLPLGTVGGPGIFRRHTICNWI